MAQQYAASDNVQVFPSSLRTYKVESKLASENNLTGIVRSVVDNDCYVRKFDSSGTGCMELVLHGYYFKIDNFNDIITSNFSSSSSVYAYIKVEDGSNLLVGQLGASGTTTVLDNSSGFIGLVFDSAGNTNPGYYSLKIMEKSGAGTSISDWSVPESAKDKVSSGMVKKDVADKNTVMYCTAAAGLVAGISIFCFAEADGLPSTTGLVDGSICFIY